jgi:hypothetical protein
MVFTRDNSKNGLVFLRFGPQMERMKRMGEGLGIVEDVRICRGAVLSVESKCQSSVSSLSVD